MGISFDHSDPFSFQLAYTQIYPRDFAQKMPLVITCVQKNRANISVGEEFSCLGTVVLPRTLQESWSQGIHAVIYKCKVINCIKTLYCIFILQGHVELTLKFMISTTINLIDISV